MNPSVLMLPIALLVWVFAFGRICGWREAAMRSLVLFGAATTLITEALSPFDILRRGPLLMCWCLFCALAIVAPRKRAVLAAVQARKNVVSILSRYRLESVLVLAITAIAGIIAFIAILSPPNCADAMAYHLPRVIYWAQSGSVRFFPTHYLPQIMLQPLAEYMVLHTYVLSGGDHFANLVQFLGFLGSVIGVSLIARSMQAGARGQVIASLFCATLPNGILQASGAKNDYLLAFWLVSTTYFAMRTLESAGLKNPLFLGASVGLGLLTKATAYLFIPPLLLAIFLPALKRRPRLMLASAAAAVACALVLNGFQYARNLNLSGSILGYDSAQGDGFFRWRVERPGWKPAISNALRHVSDQLGGRSKAWNQAVYSSVLRIHALLGIDPNDPNMTWRWTRYEAPRNANHEANAHNRWHFLLLCISIIPAWIAWRTRKNPQWMLYYAGLFTGFVAFCFYLKWQPFLARLELPLFVLGSPVAGLAVERLRFGVAQAALCLVLLNNARPFLLENWVRPLKGPQSLLKTPREQNYFSDMGQWNNRESYLRAVDLTTYSGCATVGIDLSHNHLEYPFQALLLQRNSKLRFVHVGVENVSRRYGEVYASPACAVLCLDCAADDKKIAQYLWLGKPLQVGSFLLFFKTPPDTGR